MKYMPVKEFLDSGLLFLVNKDILHPLGLALSVSISEEGEYSFVGIWDCREDPGGLSYEEETYRDGQEKWLKYYDEQGRNKISERHTILGYVVQELDK